MGRCHSISPCSRFALAGLCLLLSVGGASATLPSRHYYRLGELCDSMARVASLPVGSRYVVMEARGSLAADRERPGASACWWGISWGGDSSRYEVSMRGRNTDFGNVSDEYLVDVTASRIAADGTREVICSSSVSAGMAMAGGANTLSVELKADSVAHVYVGKNSLSHVLSFDAVGCSGEGAGWYVVSRGCWQPVMVMDEAAEDPSPALVTAWTRDSIARYLIDRRGADAGEGIWTYFDRSNNPAKGMVGGRYMLATVRNDAGGYDIIYLGGAMRARNRWSEGMLKGRLSPTIFRGHFDLLWYDVWMQPVSDEANATLQQDGALLEIAFPIYETTFRFSRVPLSSLRTD